MHHKDGMAWRSRFVVTAVVVLVLLGVRAHPAQANLIVSDFGAPTGLTVYNDAGTPIIPNPLANIAASGGEGLSCLLTVGGVSELFVASGGNTIKVYNSVTGLPINNGTIVNGVLATVAGASFTALALSPDGSTLYAAGNSLGIYSFSTATGTQLAHTSQVAHDIAVSPIGNVFDTFLSSSELGVMEFNSTLTSVLNPSVIPLINSAGSPGGGLLFDTSGNLWVDDFLAGPVFNETTTGVYEYFGSDSAGGFNITNNTSISSALFNCPLGLAVGPGDGNIYVANFCGNNVLQILVNANPALDSVNVFVPNAGTNPKYLEFTENCCQATSQTPEPATLILALSGMCFCGLGWNLAKTKLSAQYRGAES